MWFVYNESGDFAGIVPDSCANTTCILSNLNKAGYTVQSVDIEELNPMRGER